MTEEEMLTAIRAKINSWLPGAGQLVRIETFAYVSRKVLIPFIPPHQELPQRLMQVREIVRITDDHNRWRCVNSVHGGIYVEMFYMNDLELIALAGHHD